MSEMKINEGLIREIKHKNCGEERNCELRKSEDEKKYDEK